MSTTMLATEVPNTLRMPIYLVRCRAVKVARPNKPKQVVNITRNDNSGIR